MEQQNRSMSLRFCLGPHQWINDETTYGSCDDDDWLVQLLEAKEQYNRHDRTRAVGRSTIKRFTMTITAPVRAPIAGLLSRRECRSSQHSL
jgi:hypothetical protein